MTTTQSIRTLTETLFADIDANAWDRCREAAAPGCRVQMGGQALDREGWIGMGQMFFAGFPGGKHELDDVIVAGNCATALGVFRGTHGGAVFGVPASGRPLALPFTSVFRFVEGRVATAHIQFDAMAMLAQIGGLPAPGAGEVVTRMLAACDAQDWATCQTLVSPQVVARIGGQTLDRDAWMGFGKLFMAAFPDGHHELHDVLVAGDRVTTVATFTGTHRGDFMGLAATGRRISFPVIHVDRIADGAIVEHRGEFDSALVARQLQ
jgi:predicted ester cyclase